VTRSLFNALISGHLLWRGWDNNNNYRVGKVGVDKEPKSYGEGTS